MADKVKRSVIYLINLFSMQQLISGFIMMIGFIIAVTRGYDGIVGKINNLEQEVSELKTAVNDMKNYQQKKIVYDTTRFVCRPEKVCDSIPLEDRPAIAYYNKPVRLLHQ